MPSKENTAFTTASDAKPLVIGIEFGRAKINAALVDERAKILAERHIETPQRTTRAAAVAMAQLILDLSHADPRGDSELVGIGIATPGVIDPPTGRVSIDGMKGWTRVPLRQMIETQLGDSGHDIRTPKHINQARAEHADSPHPAMILTTHAAAAAAAESWCGAARGKNNIVYLSLGDEVTAGILIEGKVLQGATGFAGAAGWLAVGDTFHQEYENHGALAFETIATALTRRAVEEWDGNTQSVIGQLLKTDPAQLDAATILRAAQGNDALARKVVSQTCGWLGRGLANLISILNPEAVVLGGQFGSTLKPFLDDIRQETRRWSPPEAAKQCRIVSATIGNTTGVLGAAKLASCLSQATG